MKSTFIRHFLMTSTMLLLSFVLLGSFFVVIANNYIEEDRLTTLESNANTLSLVASNYVVNGYIYADRTLLEIVSIIGTVSGNHIVLTDDSGYVLAVSDREFQLPTTRLGDSVMAEVLRNGSYRGFGTLAGFYADEHYTIGVPVTSPSSRTVGAVFISFPTANTRRVVLAFVRIFLFVGSVVLFFSWIWAYVAAQRMARPINRMAGAAREFALGNFDIRVSGEDRPDEIGGLARSFNNMAYSLQKNENLRRDFIANVSHELKTPMTNIGGYVDGILDGTIPPERQTHYLNVVSGEIKRLNRLVVQMLEISRMDAAVEVERVPFDLCELTRRVLTSLENRLETHELTLNIGFDKPIEVLADPDSITQVINNLMDNAIKYSHSGGAIDVDIRKKGGKAEFRVTNRGNTIPPEELPHLFDRFHKLDASRKSEGLGLGLYIVKTVLGKHGEAPFCESRDGVTTMGFSLKLK